jgi:putative ABC transport system permease protein
MVKGHRMKKIHVIETISRIRKTKVTFLSIMIVVSLGIAAYLGISFAEKSMKSTGNEYFNQQKFHHIQINYAYGIDDDDLQEIKKIKNVDIAEGGYTTTGFLSLADEKRLVTVQNYTTTLDLATVVEGRLPESQNEIAIEALMNEEDGVKIGDVLTIDCTEENGDNYLKEQEFTVVGIVQHPSYTCNYVHSRRGVSTKGNGNCQNFFLVSRDAFDIEKLDHCYSSIYVWSDKLTAFNCFSEDYINACDSLIEEIDTVSVKRSDNRYEEIVTEINDAIAEGEQQLEEAHTSLKEAGFEIRYGEKNIESYETEISNYEDIDTPESQQRLVVVNSKLEEARKKLSESKKEYETAEVDYNKAEKEIADAKADRDSLVNIKWSVLTRHANISYAMFEDNADGLGKLSMSFALVYIIVALMVCYSSIGRMIVEQRYIIGTQKALGYRKGEILRKYLIYSTLCTIIGSAIGLLTAIFAIEDLALHSYEPIYFISDYKKVFDPYNALIITGCAVVSTLISTSLACSKLIKEPAVQLLTYKVPENTHKYFFEKWTVWKRMKLFNQTVIKNILNNKKHVFTSIIGIAGCTALMVIGFTLKFSIELVNTEQFKEIQRYDVRLPFTDISGREEKEFVKYLNQYTEVEYINLMEKMVTVQVNGDMNIKASLLCSNTMNLDQFFEIEDSHTHKESLVPLHGVLLSENTAEYYGINKSDYINIVKSNGEYIPVQVSGFFRNFVNHYVIISPEYYEQMTGESVQNNTFFVKYNGVDEEAFKAGLEKVDGYIDIIGKETGITIFDNIANSIDSVIKLLIFMSAIMALIVVLNISVMYITEKSRVLTILRINGFTLKETKSFIARSDVALTSLGLVFGTSAGIILGYIIVNTVETECVSFVDTPNLLACSISCIISIAFTIIVNIIARRRIKYLPLNNVDAAD